MTAREFLDNKYDGKGYEAKALRSGGFGMPKLQYSTAV
jgi:hypothetical protein